MRRRLDMIRSLLGRAAVQLIGLASVASSAALLLALNAEGGLLQLVSEPGNKRWFMALIGRGEASGDTAGGTVESTGGGGGVAASGDFSAVFSFIGRFYGWWACLAWSVISMSSLAVHRLGLNTD